MLLAFASGLSERELKPLAVPMLLVFDAVPPVPPFAVFELVLAAFPPAPPFAVLVLVLVTGPVVEVTLPTRASLEGLRFPTPFPTFAAELLFPVWLLSLLLWPDLPGSVVSAFWFGSLFYLPDVGRWK